MERAYSATRRSGRRHGLWAERAIRAAADRLRVAQHEDDRVRSDAAPALDAVEAAAANARQLRAAITTATTLAQWDRTSSRLVELQALQTALDDWQRWAAGAPLDRRGLVATASTLHANARDGSTECAHLVNRMVEWAGEHGIALNLERAPLAHRLGR